jgi:predicted nucleotidyltransferase component of viral defense system
MSELHGGLSPFQLEVAHLFFGLDASEGFLLAGGAALLASELTLRPTEDLDFFQSAASVTRAREALELAATGRRWTVARMRDHESFARLQIDAYETVLVDLCTDSPPIRSPVVTVAGPTFAPDELAGRKLLALFDRAEARDFADVFDLLRRFDKDELLGLAREIDGGFDRAVFTDMLRSILRHDEKLLASGGAQPDVVRSTFFTWADELAADGSGPRR